MKKIYIGILIASLFVSQEAFARDQINIVGSSTVYPFSSFVAERFGKTNNFRTPVIESNGTGGGFKLFCGGIGEKFPDISNASRAIKDSERDLCKSNGINNIIEFAFGNDGIVFANSAKGKKINFTQKQLWLALAENGPKPKKWNEIDPTLPDQEIRVFIPPATSGTRDSWESLVMQNGCSAEVKSIDKEKCSVLRSDSAVVEVGENDALIVQKLNSDSSSFGIFGFSYFDSNRDLIQALAIDSIEPSIDSIQEYKYPVSRPLFFYVKGEHLNVVPGLKDYVGEFVSQRAVGEDGYLLDIGLVPLSGEMNKKLTISLDKLK